ncbi:hypothetical protein C8R45DRAFT_1130350 [Mycena sanguinolenta]|nr:hypothetical protein C8R45DRAFT_1130350 [Mycena sanguinolenta]
MEGPFAQPQPPPRLRVSRQPLAAVADRSQSPAEQNAGPSRLMGGQLGDSARRDEELEPTPKPHQNSNPVPPLEAAGRLRALLDLMPKTQPKTQARPASPSEVESDFDPPRFSPPPSEARKSLKDVFAHAIREPGDTPVKAGRIRRNSTSEVDDIPRDNAKNKGKRKSLSDEEVDKPNRSSGRSETSLRSSQAATFDILRERLNSSRTPLKNEAAPTLLYDSSTADNSGDTAAFFRDLNSSRATPPAATSTPAHSMEMASDSKFHTNLMEHDSDMQHMMDLDSYEGDSGRNRPVSFPPSRGKPTPRPSSSHAHASTSQSHRLSYNGHSSRPVSQLSHLHTHDSHHDDPEHLKELEHGWNKHNPKDHEKQHSQGSRSHSPMPGMHGPSQARVQSNDPGHSLIHHDPRPGSQMSSHSGTDSQHDDSVHLKELEGGWNKTHPKGPPRTHSHGHDDPHIHFPVAGTNGHSRVRTQSGGSIHSVEERSRKLSDVHSPVERSRKLSQPLRPGSAQSLLPPAITRRSSSNCSSDDEELEIRHEIDHERERNWNAPIPKWHEHPSHGHHHVRPKPSTPSSSVSTPSILRPGERPRAESLKSRGTPITGSSKTSIHETLSPQARPKSSLGSRPRPVSYPARPTSPLPPPRPHSPLPPARPRSPLPPRSLDDKSKSKPVLSTSHSTLKPTPHPRSPERERGHSRMPSSPSPSPAHKPVNRGSMSHIPIRTPGKTQDTTSNGHSEVVAAPQLSHTDLFHPAAQVPELSEPESSEGGQNGDFLTETDEGDDHPDVRTPTVETIVLPPAEQSRLQSPPSPLSVVTDDEEVLRKAMATAPPPSPPPSPPSPTPSPRKPTVVIPSEPAPTLTTILDSITTPTKRPSFISSRAEFQTPSPPHGLPDLPDPPSSSDEETETERPSTTPLRFNGASDTFTKTPRPPGAWASTPAPVARTNSLPAPEPEESECQYDSGLATPVPSLSRASSLPTQTPKPPGGWVATPTPRKSILKVRFNPQQTELELSATEDFSSTNGHSEESREVSETSSLPVEADRVHSPELPHTPQSPTRSPTRSPRRSPSIRVVDAFGRPESKPAKSPKNRNKNPVRIVDAMGREVEPTEQSIKAEVLDDVPMNHNEALRVVREGVTALAQKLDEFDTSSDFVLLDEDRLRDLDNASRAARAAREDLKQTYETDRTAQLRASMLRSRSSSQMREVDSRPPSPRLWAWTFIILSQVLFIFLIYRFRQRSARELFLTTYYDPFHPDLHLYGIKYDYLTFPRTLPTMTSLSDTWRQEGFTAFLAHLVDMVVLFFADWRADTWRRWGGDDMQQSMQWPPT